MATLLTGAQVAVGRNTINILQFAQPASGFSAWQPLAVLATIWSAVAAVAGAMYKQQEIASRLGKAQNASAKLEGLESSLELSLINIKDANTRYGQCIADIPFIRAEHINIGSRASIDVVTGEITTPTPSARVGRSFPVLGRAIDVGPKVHLWIAVEVNGLIWPREGEIVANEDGAWSSTVFEDGASSEFSLSLLAADEKAHRSLVAWVNAGKRNNRYSELTSLPGTRRLARVDGLRISGESTAD